ncbi:hypothetical protein ACQEU3_20365 [Spirillospora sp. CA-253888]
MQQVDQVEVGDQGVGQVHQGRHRTPLSRHRRISPAGPGPAGGVVGVHDAAPGADGLDGLSADHDGGWRAKSITRSWRCGRHRITQAGRCDASIRETSMR